MNGYFECTKVGVEFLEQTKNVFFAEEIIKATPDQIFRIFEDPGSWPVWGDPILKVEWTSPKPFGIGTTRTVHMVGGIVGYEEFVEWEPCKRMAFSFVACSKNLTEKFIEDYRVTDLENGSCRVEWYMAMETRGFARHFMFITRPVMKLFNRYLFRKFKKYAEAYAMNAK